MGNIHSEAFIYAKEALAQYDNLAPDEGLDTRLKSLRSAVANILGWIEDYENHKLNGSGNPMHGPFHRS